MVLFTIGYERASFAGFAETLVDAGVDLLIDVRARPHSRRREFARKHLGAGLDGYGIRYESWPELGTPVAGREAAKRRDLETFSAIFHEQLSTPESRAALDKLIMLSQGGNVCLMCYEREPSQCHRTLICERLKEQRNVEIHDLFPPLPATDR